MIVIAGATCSGKTELSLELAKCLDCEIVSADSMQVYKLMDIGTCKVKNRNGIRHYMIDEVYPDQMFSVAKYKSIAEKYIQKIKDDKKTILVVGGSGFYIDSILYKNNYFLSAPNYKLREKLEQMSNQKLLKIINKIDPLSSELIINKRKIIRAIEFFCQTKRKFSEYNFMQKENKIERGALLVILNASRDVLYDNINQRTKHMFESGLIEETKYLLNSGYDKCLPSMQSIGYKESIKYIEHEIDFETAVELTQKNTRRYAKRQMTWFRNRYTNYSKLLLINKDDFNDTRSICNHIKKIYVNINS
jgi:tRNA dimethylallyltransferase